LPAASGAIDGSKFKAVNNRDRNFTRAKMERRRVQMEESVARYLQQLDMADRHEPSNVLAAKTTRLKEKIAKLKEEMRTLQQSRRGCWRHPIRRSPSLIPMRGRWRRAAAVR
jgi:transposase